VDRLTAFTFLCCWRGQEALVDFVQPLLVQLVVGEQLLDAADIAGLVDVKSSSAC
jgi:hypothetical protein